MNLNVTDIDTVTPLWWPNYSIGILFGVLGLVGAAIVVYFSGWEKLMGKSVRLLECEEEINSKKRIAEKLNDKNDGDKRKVWEEIIDIEERRLSEERIFTRNLGVLLFILIGGVLASIIANTMLQAIIVGAGWIGVIGAYGIKKDSDVRREIRNKKDDELLEEWIKTTKELIEDALKEQTVIPEDLETKMEEVFREIRNKKDDELLEEWKITTKGQREDALTERTVIPEDLETKMEEVFREIRNKKDDELLEEWKKTAKGQREDALRKQTVIPDDLETKMEKAFEKLKEKSSRNKIY